MNWIDYVLALVLACDVGYLFGLLTEEIISIIEAGHKRSHQEKTAKGVM